MCHRMLHLTAVLFALLLPCPQCGSASADQPRIKGTVLLADLAGTMPRAMKAGRKVLLGERDPDGNSCVRYLGPGETDKKFPKVRHGDPKGGPGLRVLQIYHWDHKAKSPIEDFRWHQETFIPFLCRLCGDNQRASRLVAELDLKAANLAKWFRSQQKFPTGLTPTKAAADGWPGHCLAELNAAIAAGDLSMAQKWSGELSAATFAMLDLHRWLELLLNNHLVNLRMLTMCRQHFLDTQQYYAERKYDPRMCVSRFAAGSLGTSTICNYIEVERQAECLYRNPRLYAEALRRLRPVHQGPLLSYVPPDIRKEFVVLCDALGPYNRAVLKGAVSRPFERSYIANILFRCKTAGVIPQLAQALKRFDRLYPRAEVWQLMDILPYRAGLGMSGIEWGDRFDARLMAMAGRLQADTPRKALLAARSAQYGVYGGSANYKGLVLTLRRSLDLKGKMDCIRATDMIGALVRNAGRPGFLIIRWARGTSGHSVAAMQEPADGRTTITIVDGLYPPGKAVSAWPEAYRSGHGEVRSVELFGRGLDSCVFLEGLILRGPNAGKSVRATVPYLPGWDK